MAPCIGQVVTIPPRWGRTERIPARVDRVTCDKIRVIADDGTGLWVPAADVESAR